MKINEKQKNDMSHLFKTIADPTRIEILFVLKKGALSVSEIVDILKMSQSRVSHQLRILKQANLVQSERKGKMIYYRLADMHVHTIFSQALEHIDE